jgi:hypothetical protein
MPRMVSFSQTMVIGHPRAGLNYRIELQYEVLHNKTGARWLDIHLHPLPAQR